MALGDIKYTLEFHTEHSPLGARQKHALHMPPLQGTLAASLIGFKGLGQDTKLAFPCPARLQCEVESKKQFSIFNHSEDGAFAGIQQRHGAPDRQ
jgi:hypothetical protein